MESNNIRKYNSNFYSTGPIKFADFVSDKCDNVHEQLYKEALYEYYLENHDEKYSDCESFLDFLKDYKIVEIKNKEYSMPSAAIICDKHFPYKQEKVDLSDWWNDYQYDESNKDISELIEDEESLIDAKLVYINYVTGKCKFKSKMTGKEFWATTDYINKDTEIDEEMTLKGTFGDLRKNNLML